MAAGLLLPIAADGAAKGIEAGIAALGNIGGGKRRAADMTFGALYQNASMALGILAAARQDSPDDTNLGFLEIQLLQMQATAKAGMSIFDKAVDPE